MRIQTFCDLSSAWESCTILGKIFYFWLIVIGWISLFIVATYLTGVVEVGTRIGFLRFDDDEPEENKTTD